MQAIDGVVVVGGNGTGGAGIELWGTHLPFKQTQPTDGGLSVQGAGAAVVLVVPPV